MIMSLTTRTAVFAGMVALTLGCCLIFSNPATNPSAGVVVWLPEDIPGLASERGEMGVMEKKWLPEDTTFLKMTYRETGLPENVANYRALNATLIVAGSDSRSLHRPAVCLTAQGWSINKAEVVRLETAGGPLEVMDYHLSTHIRESDGSPKLDEEGNKIIQRAHYIYWWAGPDASTPHDETKVWMSVWNSILKGENERWAYPAIMVMVDERYADEGVRECRKRAFDYIREYAPMFQKSLGAQDRGDAVPLITL